VPAGGATPEASPAAAGGATPEASPAAAAGFGPHGRERSRAKFSPRSPANTGPSQLAAQKSPRPSQRSALMSSVDPSTHGARSRSGTGTGLGPTSAWLRPAPQHRSFRHTAASGSPPAPSFSAAPSFTPFRSIQLFRGTQLHAVPYVDNRIATELPLSVNRTALRRSAIYRQTGRFPLIRRSGLQPSRSRPPLYLRNLRSSRHRIPCVSKVIADVDSGGIRAPSTPASSQASSFGVCAKIAPSFGDRRFTRNRPIPG
jgi:hypothetical protein